MINKKIHEYIFGYEIANEDGDTFGVYKFQVNATSYGEAIKEFKKNVKLQKGEYIKSYEIT